MQYFLKSWPVSTIYFLSHKYSRGSPHCWYINSNKLNCTERKGERERTTVYRLYNCTEREGKKRTAGGSQPWSPKEDRKVALFESQSLWACSLASSTKFCFQETREGRPRSKIKLFLCFCYDVVLCFGGSREGRLERGGALVNVETAPCSRVRVRQQGKRGTGKRERQAPKGDYKSQSQATFPLTKSWTLIQSTLTTWRWK